MEDILGSIKVWFKKTFSSSQKRKYKHLFVRKFFILNSLIFAENQDFG